MKSRMRLSFLQALTNIMNSSLNLDEVYRDFACRLSESVPVDRAAIIWREGEQARVFSMNMDAPSSKGKMPTGGGLIPLERTGLDWLIEHRQPHYQPDLAQEGPFTSDAQHRKIGLRSYLRLPLFFQGEVIGALNLGSKTSDAYSADERQLLEALAAQIAPNVAHARLYEGQKRRTEQLAALHHVSQAVSGSLDLDAVASQALEAALKVLDMDAGAVRYVDEDTQELVLLCQQGLPEEMVRERQTRPRVKIGESLAGRVAQSGETLVVDNFSQDSMSVYETNRTSGFDFFVGLPLKVKGKVMGTISGLSRHRRTFGTDDMELMADLGSMVGMAIANARLFEQVKAAEREREVERMKREFIAVASHELRTPMTAVYGFAELLLNSKGLDEVKREWVGRIHMESQRTIRLIEDMLNVSRIDSGNVSLKLEAVTLAPIIAGLTTQLSPRYPSHSFRMDIPDGFTEVWADVERLTEVLYNLMDNAAKFSPQGGRVAVTARWDEERGQAVIAITDWGVGIPEGGMPHVFDRFHRIRRPETEGIRGTGLGLHIAKSLVDIMQGRIWVESRENEGSTFYVALPVPKR